MNFEPPFKGEDLTGQKFGRLTIVKLVSFKYHKRWDRPHPLREAVWRCACDCGGIIEIPFSYFKYGDTGSCGCLHTEQLVARSRKHGMAKRGNAHPAFNVWQSMIARCHRKSDSAYHNYGGRGIKVCKRWRSGFKNFWDDMGESWKQGLSIERKDNNGPYSPENCKWATIFEQSRNRRNNIRLTFNGQTRVLSEWSELLGINYGTLCSRIFKSGWTHERALLTPVPK